MKKITYLVLAIVLNCAPNLLAVEDVQQTGNLVVLANEKVALTIDLKRRQLEVTNVVTKVVVLDSGPNFEGRIRDIDLKTLKQVGRYIKGKVKFPENWEGKAIGDSQIK